VAALGDSTAREIGSHQSDLQNGSDVLDVLAQLEAARAALGGIDRPPRPVAIRLGAFDDLVAVIAGWWGVVLGAAAGVTAFSLFSRPVALWAVAIAISELAVHRRRSARIVTATITGLFLGVVVALWS
jgi:hypothetical protein